MIVWNCINKIKEYSLAIIQLSRLENALNKFGIFIENTYLKYRKEQSRTAALKSYKKQEGQIKFL